jgi:hypothetical protein
VRITPLSVDAAVAAAVEALGFDASSVDLSVPEVVAAAVRRAASLTCPTTPRNLAAVVRAASSCLVKDANDEEAFPVRAMVDNLAAYGDLIEAPVRTDGGVEQRMLFLAQPSFVLLGTAVLLCGIRADAVPYLTGAAAESIEYDGHVRRLTAGHGLGPSDLEELGLREVSAAHWLDHPLCCEAEELVAEYDSRLNASGRTGTIDDCTILDSAQPPTYYKGRWRTVARRDSGRYVARRPAAYGSALWSYVEIAAGEVVRVLDLPATGRLNRACDEAWRLQAAIDTLRGTPQTVRLEQGGRSGVMILHLPSPPPAWAQRRLDVVGRSVPRQRSLLSYALPEDQVEAELEFLEQLLWTVRQRNGENG